MGQQQEQQDARKSLLPICFRDGQITVGDGLPVLDKVTHQASIQRDGDIMVLSLRAKNGPASLEDIPLGQVRVSGCVSGHAQQSLPAQSTEQDNFLPELWLAQLFQLV